MENPSLDRFLTRYRFGGTLALSLLLNETTTKGPAFSSGAFLFSSHGGRLY